MNNLKLNEIQRQVLIDNAQALLGIPYKMGAKATRDIIPADIQHLDCSGLTKYCFDKIAIDIPDGSINQYNASKEIDTVNIDTGDLAFKKTHDTGIIEHVALIVIVNGLINVIEAEAWYGKVIMRTLELFKTNKPNASQFAGVRRLNFFL